MKPSKTPTKKQILKREYQEAKREYKIAQKDMRKAIVNRDKKNVVLNKAEQKYRSFKSK